ncbi:MAG: hypothetical protein R3F20_16580 [Planctomycetota bacterium]
MQRSFFLALSAILALSCGLAAQVEIPLVNGGFEQPTLPANDLITVPTPGWAHVGAAGAVRPQLGFDGYVPRGRQTAGLQAGTCFRRPSSPR